jgi:hypothetical protein
MWKLDGTAICMVPAFEEYNLQQGFFGSFADHNL